MDIIYGWIKNIICFYIFITVILHLLPKENYRKYVRFFTGMLLVILVMNPVLSLLGKEELILQKISQTRFFQELDNLKMDTQYLEQSQKKVYMREYERAIAMDIDGMAARKQLNSLRTEVHLSGEYQVESVTMELKHDREDEFSLGEKSSGTEAEDSAKVQEFRKELMEFYQLEEGQIEIALQGG